MCVYAISDLHLAVSVKKPMDVFGPSWEGYMERLRTAWCRTVGEGDTVIIPGDISWATYLEDALEDFRYIDALPGSKIILKGNHDYWWSTLSKMQRFLNEKDLKTIRFLHNNCFLLGNTALCGTRGWKCPGEEDFSAEDHKIYLRELGRLELSLKAAVKTDSAGIVVAMHFPPFNDRREPSGFVDIMASYGVSKCIYGHLHRGAESRVVEGRIKGIEFTLVSADFLEFQPLKLV